MNRSFEYTSSLEYRLKAAHAQLQAFQSGEKYVQMEAQRLREVRTLERTVDGLKKELADSRRETVTVRNQWFAIFEQLQKECERREWCRRADFAKREYLPIRR